MMRLCLLSFILTMHASLVMSRTGNNVRSRSGNVEEMWENAFSGDDPQDSSIASENWEDSTKDSDSLFHPAQPVEFFQKIDPTIFEWVNPKAVQAGNLTCGFLHAPLGAQEDRVYPTVEVYICMRFADIQPAPKGNLFVHCGGPGSLSFCVIGFLGMLGEDNPKNYNIISIDQRGMGRSWPSFVHPECAYGLERNEDGELVETGQKELQFSDDNLVKNLDVFSEESIQNYTNALKERVLACWTCQGCDFHLNATQEDGNVTAFHFLEFSGTKQLVEDMNRFRKAIGADKLSLYGISYGTQVMSTFATIFPDLVDKFIVDSNTAPTSNLFESAWEFAEGINQRIDYLIYSCSARNALEPGACPVDDMRVCINDFNQLASQSTTAIILSNFIKALYEFSGQAKDLCDLAASGNLNDLEVFFDELYPAAVDNATESIMMRSEEDDIILLSSGPTLEEFVYGNPEYTNITSINYGGAVGALVLAQDWSGNVCYNDEFFIKQTIEVNKMYTGAGTGHPANSFALWYGFGFYWPKGTPLPPRGNPYQTGIVSGQLFDTATPYTMTQKMRASFPSTRLLTSQSISHGLRSAIDTAGEPSCQIHIVKYLETGVVGFDDGTFCGSPFATNIDLQFTFGAF